MVANAGMSFTKPFIHSESSSLMDNFLTTLTQRAATMEDWDLVYNLNAKGVFLCYQYAAKAMIKQGRGGRIIGACSVAGKQGWL
jgi:NAD(P)-dependent dehydrogenase (short-subunit alcohol dehydrogenase family)